MVLHLQLVDMVQHLRPEATAPHPLQAGMGQRQRPEVMVRPLGVAMELLRRPEDMVRLRRLRPAGTVSRTGAYT